MLVAACALLIILCIVFGFRGRDGFFYASYGSWGLVRLVLAWRPPTLVTAQGVRRPWRRRGFVPWTDVAAVVAPQYGVGGIRLQLGDGKLVQLDRIPADRAAAVAAIGGKELIRPSAPTVPTGPPPPPRRGTDEDVLADVTRQAAALARQRQELAALSRRLKP